MCRRILLFALIIGLLLGMAGCSSTTIGGSWKDPEYQGGRLDKVLVIGIAQKETIKRVYEDAFVAALQQQGINASPGYKVLAKNESNNKDLIVKRVKELGFKNVLISRVADKKTVEFIHPSTTTFLGDAGYRYRYYRDYPYYNHYFDYYDRGYATVIHSPSYTTTSDLVILETNIYESGNGEIIYSVQTQSLLDYGSEKTIKEVVRTIMKNLKDNQMI
ncbi:MAG: hypothetical protein Q7U44_08435 [Desulfuromonadales bacterium]|nr:hypothetical protein [Desulfuromonadales bacterium]